MPQSALVRFYRGEAGDHRGRHLEEILGWDDKQLEGVHDFIQWLFPLDEQSAVNRFAPIVTSEDCRAFRTDRALAASLRRSLLRMLAFYGFELGVSQPPLVRRSEQWDDRARVWLHPHNHNYLRLTRMIKSLKLLGLEHDSRALYEALAGEYQRAPSVIGSTTLEYWQAAGGR